MARRRKNPDDYSFRIERVSGNRFIFHGERVKKRFLLKGTCLLWFGVKSSKGYAILGNVYIHSLMYRRLSGAISEGLELDHLCRNRTCINPRHLEPVTRSENSRRGDKAKLTYKDVEQIRTLRSKGVPLKEIADRFKVHSAHVSRIVSHKRWKL